MLSRLLLTSFFGGFFVFCFSQTNLTYYPRTILVYGEAEVRAMPDEISLDFNTSNESYKNKLKMPIDKIDAQIKTQMKTNNIPLQKLETENETNMCNLTTKRYSLQRLTIKEFETIYAYLSKHLFVNDLYISKATVKKEVLQQQMLNELTHCSQSAKTKAEQIALVTNEKIVGVQSINAQDLYNLFEENYDYTPTIDNGKVEAMSIKLNIPVEYQIEDKMKSTNPISIPKTLYTTGRAVKEVKVQAVSLLFTHSLIDYEEGDPKVVFENSKKNLEMLMKLHNVKVVKSEENQYSSSDFATNYTVEVSNYDNIQSFIKKLGQNKNVSSIMNSGNDVFKFDPTTINSELIPLAIKSSNDLSLKIAKSFGVEILQPFDYKDGNAENYYINNSSVAEAAIAATAISLYNATSSIELTKRYVKMMYISYQLK